MQKKMPHYHNRGKQTKKDEENKTKNDFLINIKKKGKREKDS